MDQNYLFMNSLSYTVPRSTLNGCRNTNAPKISPLTSTQMASWMAGKQGMRANYAPPKGQKIWPGEKEVPPAEWGIL